MEEFLHVSHTGPIPDIFHSDKTGKPFVHCKICNKNVVESGELYMIEKAYGKPVKGKEHELVFELAYCMPCVHQMNQQLSEESRMNMANYFNANTNLAQRDAELKKHNLIDPEVWLHSCAVKNKSMDEVDEYQIYALCQEDELMYHEAPYMICGEAVDELLELLSSKSLDILNDMMTDLIDVPPEFRELFKHKTPLIF